MEPLVIGDMDTYDYGHNQNDNIPRGTNGGRLPPQLNQTVPGHGNSSQGCNDKGGSDDDDGDASMNVTQEYLPTIQNGYVACHSTSDGESENVFGQEGVEDTQMPIIPPTPGCECSCHNGLLAMERQFCEPGTSFLPEGHSPSLSVIAQHGSSAEISMESSIVLPSRARTPSEFDIFIGALFSEPIIRPTPTITSLVHSPLRLGNDVVFARSVKDPFYYATRLSFHEEEEDNDSDMN